MDQNKLNTTLYLLPDNIKLFIYAVSIHELYVGEAKTGPNDPVGGK